MINFVDKLQKEIRQKIERIEAEMEIISHKLESLEKQIVERI